MLLNKDLYDRTSGNKFQFEFSQSNLREDEVRQTQFQTLVVSVNCSKSTL